MQAQGSMRAKPLKLHEQYVLLYMGTRRLLIARQDTGRRRTVAMIEDERQWERFVRALESGEGEVAAVHAIDATPERKYALTKLGPGDYLLPSNDAKTLWRLRSYEDGPDYGLDPSAYPRNFTRWAVWRWTGNIHDALAIAESVENGEDYDKWDHHKDGHETRRQAVNAALRAERER